MRKYGVLALGLASLVLIGACATAYPDESGDNPIGGGPDASRAPDATPVIPDASAPGFPDAAMPPDGGGGPADANLPQPPDAAPVTPDAAPITPDAAPVTPDAAPPPDAPAPIDAAPPSAICDLATAEPDCDGCGDAVDLTYEALGAAGATTWGDTKAYANDLEPPSSCTSGYGQDGPDAVYRVNALAGETISVVMTPDDFDGAVYILSDCGDPTTCVSGADDAFGSSAETLDYAVPASGWYFIVVDSYLSTVSGCYTLEVFLG